MSDPYLGEIRLFPYTYAPSGWAFCHGQLIPIAQNTALFALLGTNYGGDGKTVFALPDLRGRVAVASGQGPGGYTYSLGESAGAEEVTLTAPQMPTHTHGVAANGAGGGSPVPTGRVLGRLSSGSVYARQPDGTVMSPQTIMPAGASQPHTNMQPYLSLHYCIALQGIYPSVS